MTPSVPVPTAAAAASSTDPSASTTSAATNPLSSAIASGTAPKVINTASGSPPVCAVTPAPNVVVTTSPNSKPAAVACSPRLRSVPVTSVVKPEPMLDSVNEAGPSSTVVIDVDADWSSKSPLDFSSRLQSVLSGVESPPNELAEASIPKPSSPEVMFAAVSATRTPPATELPIASLRSDWMTFVRPVQQVSKKFLMLEDFLQRADVAVFRATDSRTALNGADAEWCAAALSRFNEVYKGFFRIPLSIRCDRTFFERPDDALYIERMWQYLFNESVAEPPICTDDSLYRVVVPEDKAKAQQNRLCWAFIVMRQRVVTFEDLFVSRRAAIDMNKVLILETEEEALLSVPWDLFPVVPAWLREVVDMRSAPMTPIRALTYFTKTARRAGSNVFKRWNKALQVELAVHVAVAHYTAWARPVLDQPRIWYPPAEHVSWLKKFVLLPPIPVYYEALGKYVMVSIKDVVAVLEDARARARPVTRKDYCTRTMVEFVATPNSQVFTTDPLREADLLTVEKTKPSIVKPRQPPQKTPAAAVLSAKGVLIGRVLKKDFLRKHTRMSQDMVNALQGSGPWCATDVINQLVDSDQRLTADKLSLTSDITYLRQDNERLRDDVTRYREDATRLTSELRTARENAMNAACNEARRYDDNARGYGSRGFYDPYERRY